mgnify:CR=1 FL=1
MGAIFHPFQCVLQELRCCWLPAPAVVKHLVRITACEENRERETRKSLCCNTWWEMMGARWDRERVTKALGKASKRKTALLEDHIVASQREHCHSAMLIVSLDIHLCRPCISCDLLQQSAAVRCISASNWSRPGFKLVLPISRQNMPADAYCFARTWTG